jgi:Uma2 family endonuclease
MTPTGSTVSVYQYLNTSYRPDCDYLAGEVKERNPGEKDHGQTMGRVYRYLCNRYPELDERLIPEQRIQISADRFRVADLCLLAEDAPDEQIVRYPPLLCIEIVSGEDRWTPFWERLDDYYAIGVPACWVINPASRSGWFAIRDHMTEAAGGILRAGEYELPLNEILK